MKREWETEPDCVIFTYKGYKCEVKRDSVGKYLCGHVEVPHDHPAWGRDYDAIDIECHGGLTYSHTKGGVHCIGFDCAHFNDLIPGMLELEVMGFETRVYRNFGFVEKECIKIVDQLDEMRNKEEFELFKVSVSFVPDGLKADVNVNLKACGALEHVYHITEKQAEKIINKNINQLLSDIEMLIKNSISNDSSNVKDDIKK